MKKVFSFLLSFAFISLLQAQTGAIRPEQLQGATPGYIMVVGSDGLYHSQITPYILFSDSAHYTTPSGLQVVAGKVPVSQTFANGVLTTTLANGTTITTTLDGRYALLSTIGQPSGIAPLGTDGKVPSSYLPALTSRQTFVVSSQSAMLALSANQGDFAVRTDINQTYVLQSTPATTLSNWVQLPSSTAPVTSVNGQTGNVSLTTSGVGEGTNMYFTTARVYSALSAGTGLTYNNLTGVYSITPTGVTPGTVQGITFNAQGQITSVTNMNYLTSASLAPYATISALTTAGGIAIPAANITGLPNTAGTETIDEFTGSTSSVVTLSHSPLTTTVVKVYQNGQLKKQSLYTVSGTAITLGFARTSTDVISADYNY